MPRVSPQDDIAQLALCSVFSLIKGMYLSKPVICRSATRTPCCYRAAPSGTLICIVLTEAALTATLWGKWICPQLSINNKTSFFSLPPSVSRRHSYIPPSLCARPPPSVFFFLSHCYLFSFFSKLTALHTPPHQRIHTRTCTHTHTPQLLVQIEWLYCHHCLAGTISPKQFMKWQLSNTNKCLIYLPPPHLSMGRLFGWKHELSTGTQSTTAIKKQRFNQHLILLSVPLTKVCIFLHGWFSGNLILAGSSHCKRRQCSKTVRPLARTYSMQQMKVR